MREREREKKRSFGIYIVFNMRGFALDVHKEPNRRGECVEGSESEQMCLDCSLNEISFA